MNLRELEIRRTYDSGEEGIEPVRDFLEPCLSSSANYDRLSGYFSSRVLALAARGLGDFLASDGRMRLVMSSRLTASDYQKLKVALVNHDTYDYLFEDIEMDGSALADMLERKHFEAMCWLLAHGRLEIRIVVHIDENERSPDAYVPIFHPKIGIFEDSDGNRVSFSGSVNETVAGWTGNIEEFKVFKSWDETTSMYVDSDQNVFDRYWEDRAGGSFRTFDLPDAIKQQLITQSPIDMPQINAKKGRTSPSGQVLKFRNYQIDAIDAWIKRGMRGVLEMATGTGKTKTARGCIDQVIKKGSSCVLVTAPFEHIAKQWMEELSDLDPVLASGTRRWREDIRQAHNKKKLGRRDNLVVVAVQNTASSSPFVELMNEVSSSFDFTLMVGDEVHGLGASFFQEAMQSVYQYRLGLSATPQRYFDEEGTQSLLEYFGDTAYRFSTKDAMEWVDPLTGQRALSPYKYFPIFVTLEQNELDEYLELSESIAKLSGEGLEPQKQSLREALLFQRAAIVKTASQKIPALAAVLQPLVSRLEFCLIYCHDMEQLGEVGVLLSELGVTYQKITGEESNRGEDRFQGLSERDWILRQFTNGNTKTLLAIKCLDEGVDIPAARTGFILASSGNPREFIQRRGRLLRPSPDKQFATIYDFVVRPPVEQGSKSKSASWIAIFKKELERIEEISSDALNRDDVKTIVARLLLEIGNYGHQ
jgi:superfamily II DNA or RNA helicase